MLSSDLAYLLKEILKLSRQDSSLIKITTVLAGFSTLWVETLDSECFTRACLTISKDRGVVALYTFVYNWLSNLLKYSVLRNAFTSDKVKSELFSIFGVHREHFVICHFTDASALLGTFLSL